MDPLTHTLTGLALSRAGLKRLSVYATPLLLLAANAPDIDILTAPGGSVSYLHYHRHITHAFLTMPLMALLPVLVVRLFAGVSTQTAKRGLARISQLLRNSAFAPESAPHCTRRPFDWKWAYLVSLAGVASHPLLDWMNAYGIRLFLPFSSHWYSLDISSLTDFWILSVLLVAALVPLFSRLVSSEIGARPSSGRGWAIAALCFLVLYPCGRYLLRERAVAVLDARLYGGAAPLRVAAFPTPANPFRWRGLVETDAFYSILDVNLLGEFDPASGRLLYKPEPYPQADAAKQAAGRTEAFRVFLDFSQYPFWQFRPLDNGMEVQVSDLRFGSPPHPGFVARATVDQAGRVVDSGFSYGPARGK
jgi:inner membrane protein